MNFGLADPELRTRTSEALANMVDCHVRTLAGGHNELDALVANASRLFERVPQEDEIKFRERMRKDGNAIAAMQCQITDVFERMQTHAPD